MKQKSILEDTLSRRQFDSLAEYAAEQSLGIPTLAKDIPNDLVSLHRL